MSQILLGWPNGTLGLLLGTLVGLLIIYQAWRDSPWDVHDEYSYAEPSHLTFATAVPSLVLLGVLLTLLLGLGVLDKEIRGEFAMLGDILGVLLVPLTIWYVFHWSRRPRPS